MNPTMQQVTAARERLLKALGPDAGEEMRLCLALLADAAAEHVRIPELSKDAHAVFHALEGKPELEAAQRLALLADLGGRFHAVAHGDFKANSQQDWCDWYRVRYFKIARAVAPVARRLGYVQLAGYLEGWERQTYYVPNLEPDVNALFERVAQAEEQLAEVREHWRATDEERAQMLSERDAALEKASEHCRLAEQQEARVEGLQQALAAHSGCITRLSMLFDCPSAFQDVEAMAAGWKVRGTIGEDVRRKAVTLLKRQEVASSCAHSADRNLLTEACPKCGGEVSPEYLWAFLREIVNGLPEGAVGQEDALIAFRDAVVRATAELRHAYGNHMQTEQRIEPVLVTRAIQLLEEATTNASASPSWQARMLKLLGASTPAEFEAALTTLTRVLGAVSDFARGRLASPQEQAKQVGRMLLDLLEPLSAVPSEAPSTPPFEETAGEKDEGMEAFATAFNTRQEELAQTEERLKLIIQRLQAPEALLRATQPAKPGWPERLRSYLLGPVVLSGLELALQERGVPLPLPEVPGFIGEAPKGPFLKPVFLNSLEMYDTVFGAEEHSLRTAVRAALFEPGVLLVVVRVERLTEASARQARELIEARCVAQYTLRGPGIIPQEPLSE